MGAANSNEPLRVALLGLDAVGEYTMYIKLFHNTKLGPSFGTQV